METATMEIPAREVESQLQLKEVLETLFKEISISKSKDFKQFVLNLLMERIEDIQDGIEGEERYKEFLKSGGKGISWEEIQKRIDNQLENV